MNAPRIGPSDSALVAAMARLGRQAKAAATMVRNASPEQRTAGLNAMAAALEAHAETILSANEQDVAQARTEGLKEAFIDRLALSPERLRGVVGAVREAAASPDPVGTVLADWTRPNGLRIQRVRTPLGVIGVIFESRPNVAADAAALCLRAGNASILRGGSDSARSTAAIVAACRQGLAAAGLPQDVAQVVPHTDRAAVGMMLQGLEGAIDVIVPRGGRSLVQRVQEEARVPVFAHLEGLCHTYLHASADPTKALAITLNAKMRRVSVCGATETLLIDRSAAEVLLPPIARALQDKGCALRGGPEAVRLFPMAAATAEDWRTEYLAPILSIQIVDGIEEAMAHIAFYGSGHTDAIVAEDPAAIEAFLNTVDSAIVIANASTQFADGGEFGFGGEIGIATGKMHARGPVGAEQLTTFKYKLLGSGQIRP
jgi:glutamate-5-semialdehyde dehydrogenase